MSNLSVGLKSYNCVSMFVVTIDMGVDVQRSLFLYILRIVFAKNRLDNFLCLPIMMIKLQSRLMDAIVD